MLDYFIADEASIPSEHKNLYENRDGGWFLKIRPGQVVARAKLDEFRTSNDTLKEENKKLTADLKKFDGVDIEKYHDLLTRENELNDGKAIKAGKLEEVVAERTAGIKADHERQLKAKENLIAEKDTKITTLTGTLKKLKIDNVIMKEAHDRGIKKGAEKFLLAACERDWDLDEDGNPFPKGADGKPRYGKDGEVMKAPEWMDDLARENDFMFDGNNGSGAPPKGGSGDKRPKGGEHFDDKNNPWMIGTPAYDLDKQMKIYGENPEQAVRLAAQAGVTLKMPETAGSKK